MLRTRPKQVYPTSPRCRDLYPLRTGDPAYEGTFRHSHNSEENLDSYSDDFGLSPGFIDDVASPELNELLETPLRRTNSAGACQDVRNEQTRRRQNSWSEESSTAPSKRYLGDSHPPPYSSGEVTQYDRGLQEDSSYSVQWYPPHFPHATREARVPCSRSEGPWGHDKLVLDETRFHAGVEEPQFPPLFQSDYASAGRIYSALPCGGQTNTRNSVESQQLLRHAPNVTITFPPALGGVGGRVDPISYFDRLPKKSPLPISNANATARKAQLDSRLIERIDKQREIYNDWRNQAIQNEECSQNDNWTQWGPKDQSAIRSQVESQCSEECSGEYSEECSERCEGQQYSIRESPLEVGDGGREPLKWSSAGEPRPTPEEASEENTCTDEKSRLASTVDTRSSRQKIPQNRAKRRRIERDVHPKSSQTQSVPKDQEVCGREPGRTSNNSEMKNFSPEQDAQMREQPNNISTLAVYNTDDVRVDSNSGGRQSSSRRNIRNSETKVVTDVSRPPPTPEEESNPLQDEGENVETINFSEPRPSSDGELHQPEAVEMNSPQPVAKPDGPPTPRGRRKTRHSIPRPRSADSLVTPRPIPHRGSKGGRRDEKAPPRKQSVPASEGAEEESRGGSEDKAADEDDGLHEESTDLNEAHHSEEVQHEPPLSSQRRPPQRKQQSFGCQVEVMPPSAPHHVPSRPTRSRRKIKNAVNNNWREQRVELHRVSVNPKSTAALSITDGAQEGVRARPKRHVMPPLEWWVGERASYARKQGEALPSLQAVYRADDKARAISKIQTRDKPPAPRKKQRAKKFNAPSDNNKPSGALIEHKQKRGTILAVLEEADLTWAEVDSGNNNKFEVSLAFENPQSTTCEIRIPPDTEKGLDNSKEAHLVGLMTDGESLECQIGCATDAQYVLTTGDWFIIPQHTAYNLRNLSSVSWARLVLNLIK